MIIWGWKGVTSTKDRGGFHCPSCNGSTDYQLKRVRRFFTLYFIPIIPLNQLGEYVECGRCRNRFEANVLSYDHEAEAGKFRDLVFKAILRTMSLVCIADGVIEDSEIDAIVTIFTNITGIQIDELDVRRDIQEAQEKGDALEGYLGAIAPMLNDAGKEMVVKACLAVATADGSFDDSEKALVSQVASILGMTPAHMMGVIADIRQDATEG